MRIVTAEEMRALDERAIRQLGIPGVVLMENAGLQVIKLIQNILGNPKGKRILILAGKGNNGGDGFVVARHLVNLGAEVKVLIVANPEEINGDAKINLDILQRMGHKVYSVVNANSLNIVRIAGIYSDLIVDAIYGTGFAGAVTEHVGKIIDLVNDSRRPIVAIDIPSGVEANTGKVQSKAIKATHTVTFALPKLGLFLEPGAALTGQLTIADISIPKSMVEEDAGLRAMVTPELALRLLPTRQADSHKGDYGRVLVVGGSEGLTGAVCLASLGALRMGAGLVTLAVPNSLHSLMEVKLTEVMTTPIMGEKHKALDVGALEEIVQLQMGKDVLALGPGMSRQSGTITLLQELIPKLQVTTVIDADGLYPFGGRTELFTQATVPIILTPHPGEMAHLLGVSIEEVQNSRLEMATKAAKDWQVTIVLKGAQTIVADPQGQVYINTTGNPGMATGGSGDVLTGIIAALVAQGLKPIEAAALGVYLHGLAGDRGKMDLGMAGLVAGDLLKYLPLVVKDLENEVD